MAELLSRDAILQTDDTVYDYVEVPEWGGKVRVKSLSATERDAWEAGFATDPGDRRSKHRAAIAKATRQERLSHVRASLVALVVVDEAGKRTFTDGDVGALGAKNAAAVDRIFEKASELSGLSEDDALELADAKAEDFDETPDAGSTTDSPSASGDRSLS